MENNGTSQAHTAGPWIVTASTNKDVYGGQDHLVVLADPIASNGQIIADIELLPNAIANARLVAAAPDLLDAAQFAYGVLCSLSNLKAVRKSSDYEELNEACDMLAVAANKACGE